MEYKIFTTLGPDELAALISEAVRNEIAALKPQQIEKPDELLTCRQVAKKLMISLPTLYKYMKEGKIKSYKISRQIRFKLSEVESALLVKYEN